MNEQKARSMLMDYLCGEISAEDKDKLETYLLNHPKLQKEVDELRQTQSLLQKMPEPKSGKKLHLVEAKSSSFSRWLANLKILWPHSNAAKTALAAAACLLLLLIVGSAASLQITSNKAGFTVSLGYGNEIVQPDSQKDAPLETKKSRKENSQAIKANLITEKEAERFLSKKEMATMLAKLQKQNKALLAAFVEKMNKQDRRQLEKIVKYFQAQRLYDLKRIKQRLNKAQLADAYRWRQTTQVLGEIIQTASVEKER